MKDVYEKTKVTLRAEVNGTPLALAKVKEVKFHVTLKEGDGETKEAPITVPVTKVFPKLIAEHEYELKVVDDKLDYYDVTYRAEMIPSGQSSYWADGDEQYRVWPKEVSITFTSDVDDVHKTAPFHTQVAANRSPVRKADAEGKWKGQVGKAQWTVAVDRPLKLVDPKHEGRARTYKLSKEKYELEYVAPKVLDPSKTIKQYVNVPPAAAGWSEAKPWGNRVRFTVGAKGDTGRAAADRLARPDDIVFVQVRFTPKTRRNQPQPSLLKNAQFVADPVDSDAKKTWKGQVKMNAQGQAEFEVELGFAGGDECEVKVGTDDSVAGPTLKFETGRKLFYELMYPDFMEPSLKAAAGGNFDFADAIRNAVTARLGAAFIEYELVKSHKYTRADAARTGKVVKAEFIGLNGRDRIIMGSKLPEDDPVAFGAADARTNHIKLADLALSTSGGTMQPQNPRLSTRELEFQNAGRDYFVPLDVDVANCSWRAHIPNPATYMQFPTLVVPNDHSAVTTAGAVDGAIRVRDKLHGVADIRLDFPNPRVGHRPTALAAPEQKKITDFLAAIMTVPHLRANNQVQLEVIAQNDNARRQQRANNVIAAIKAAFAAARKKIPTHPGLDDAGQPRTGQVKAGWFTEHRANRLKITLPTSAAGDGSEPGDFVGNPGANTCPVQVPFNVWVVYAINGNSGGGRQLFVLQEGRAPGALASTLCHELGHAMGMTIWIGSNAVYSARQPPGMDPAKHVDSNPKGPYYRNTYGGHGIQWGLRAIGVGAHCGSGVPQADWADAKFNGKTGSCIMFHAGGNADTRPAFCATCTDYLSGRKLVDIRASWKNRADADY